MGLKNTNSGNKTIWEKRREAGEKRKTPNLNIVIVWTQQTATNFKRAERERERDDWRQRLASFSTLLTQTDRRASAAN